MDSIEILKDKINNASSIAIIGHEEADMDSLASMIALKRVINNNASLFGTCHIDLFASNIDSTYSPITKGEIFLSNSELNYDLAICLDCPSKERLGSFLDVYLNSNYKIMIDHHENNADFGDANYIYKCTSTCEVLFILFKALNLELSNDILKMIYAGIITDTINLTQGTVKVSSYKIVSEIAQKINDVESLNAIKDHFLKNKTKSNLILLERALRSINFYLNDRVAIMKITRADLLDSDGTQADTLGIVNNAINIKGVSIAILFIKQDDGSYYASIRSKNGVDVATMAKKLGGGGHETVSAFSYSKNLSELKDELLLLCEEALKTENMNDSTDNLFES